MSTGKTPQDDTELEAFLGRQSPVSTDYDNLELVEPPTTLDDKILAAAKVAAKSVQRSAPKPAETPVARKPPPAQPAATAAAAGASSAIPPDPVERRKRPRPPAPETGDDDDAAPSSRRPPWLLPAVLAASVLVAVGVGLAVFMNSPSGTSDSPLDSSLFAKRARERSEEDKAAAAAASAEQDAEVVELESAPLPPPPVFEVEGPQVQDLDAAIALIRKDLLRANQVAANQEEASLESPDRAIPAAPAASAAPSVVQPRERRLTKILELYDGGNPDLAGDSLEIFLRDFEDDPVSQRILGVKP